MRLHLGLLPRGRRRNLALEPTVLDPRDNPALLFDASKDLLGLGFETIRERFQIVRTREGIYRVGDPGLGRATDTAVKGPAGAASA